eukprot:XP_001689960.1 predicted protein [Chlamydomonas reinhardtii]
MGLCLPVVLGGLWRGPLRGVPPRGHRPFLPSVQIEAESRAVRAEVAALERNLTAVAGAVRHVSEALKQLGDFENYVAVLTLNGCHMVGRVDALRRHLAAVAASAQAAVAASAQAAVAGHKKAGPSHSQQPRGQAAYQPHQHIGAYSSLGAP